MEEGDAARRLAAAGLSVPGAPPAAGAGAVERIMVNIPGPDGPRQVPVEVGIFYLLDVIQQQMNAQNQLLFALLGGSQEDPDGPIEA